jgi:4-aminobutyrate aminotransferase-like enzyme
MRARLGALKARHSSIAEVRGLGAMTAVEFCRDGDPHRPAPEIANALKAEAARRGLLLLTCGVYGNVLRIMIPLTIPETVLDEGLDILTAALDVAARA